MHAQKREENLGGFVVVHPLNDVPEQKIDTSNLGPMPMVWSVRVSLLALRLYLIAMTLLLVYHLVAQH